MKWFRLLAALFTAPLLYGLLCVALSWWMSFSYQINELGIFLYAFGGLNRGVAVGDITLVWDGCGVPRGAEAGKSFV